MQQIYRGTQSAGEIRSKSVALALLILEVKRKRRLPSKMCVHFRRVEYETIDVLRMALSVILLRGRVSISKWGRKIDIIDIWVRVPTTLLNCQLSLMRWWPEERGVSDASIICTDSRYVKESSPKIGRQKPIASSLWICAQRCAGLPMLELDGWQVTLIFRRTKKLIDWPIKPSLNNSDFRTR